MFQRGSGILLHPTSLPSPYPIGDLGPEAFKFIDFLELSGQRYWQILPLSPTGDGGAPYSAFSAFAGNTMLISPEQLVAEGLIDEAPLPVASGEYVHFHNAAKLKNEIVAQAFERFRSAAEHPLREEHEYFCRSNAWWLDDWALFRALKDTHDGQPWFEWAAPLKLRDPDAIATSRQQLVREIEREKFAQHLFFRQWLEVKRSANERGIKIIGDIPIFVAHDSADVWCNRELFKLDEDGTPLVVAGVPPDYFSKTGQLWGNPIYDWEAMQRSNDFGWWTARVSFTLETVDIVRLDHFIGFGRNWEVPFGDKTAENGNWAEVPGDALLTMLNKRLGRMPFIAEDLGEMTPAIEQLRDKFDIPGMRIMQFAFGGDAYNSWLPHNHIRNAAIYTGTHDNDTARGWYKSAPKNVKKHFRDYTLSTGREPHWDLIRVAQSSVGVLCIVPAQDLLGLGSEAKMNTPGTSEGNWSWRLKSGALDDEIADRLRSVSAMFARAD